MATETGRITIVDITDERHVRAASHPAPIRRSTIGRATTGRTPTAGSKAIRLDWLEPRQTDPAPPPGLRTASNPFLADLEERGVESVRTPGGGGGAFNPFLDDDEHRRRQPLRATEGGTRPTVG
jgi:hypothetical protein